LENFINVFYDLSATKQLLESIDDVITNPLDGDIFYPTQGLQLSIIGPHITKIYDDQDKFYENQNSPTADFELPTSDFKEIVEAWRDYLVK